MSVCENCGTNFELPANAVVTTTRVLCSPCAARRAAEKQRAKAMAAAPGPAAPSAPAPRATVPPARPVPAAPAPIVKPLTKAKARAAKPEPEADEEESESSRRSRHGAAKDREKRTAMMGWLAAAVIVVGALAVVFMIVKNKQAENKRLDAIFTQQKSVFDKVLALAALNTETASNELIKYAGENEKTWRASDNAAEVTTLIAKAKNKIEQEAQRKATFAAMEKIELGIEGIARLSPEEIAELRRLLGELEPRADPLGVEFVAKVGAARTTLDRTYASALHEDAKSFAAANPDKARLALQRFTKAEDEINKLFDDSIKSKQKESEKIYREHYETIIAESDKLVEEAFPPDALDKLPWRDLLVEDKDNKWVAAEVKGFSHRLENGVMTMIGPDADAGYQGLISIGDKQQWRDFVVDFEFTLESGNFDLYFRLGAKPDNHVTTINIGAGEGGLVAGKTYTITASMIGSVLSVSYYPEDLQFPPTDIHWTYLRKGALGFGLQEGTRLKITRLKIRELRSSGK